MLPGQSRVADCLATPERSEGSTFRPWLAWLAWLGPPKIIAQIPPSQISPFRRVISQKNAAARTSSPAHLNTYLCNIAPFVIRRFYSFSSHPEALTLSSPSLQHQLTTDATHTKHKCRCYRDSSPLSRRGTGYLPTFLTDFPAVSPLPSSKVAYNGAKHHHPP